MEATNHNSIYPNQSQIMNDPPLFKKEVIQIVKSWKKNDWSKAKSLSDPEKQYAIKRLLLALAAFYRKPVQVIYEPTKNLGTYRPQIQLITLNPDTSIITALHEFAHHLYGSSELTACRWSIHLFRKTFTVAFTKLRFQGHLLVRAKF